MTKAFSLKLTIRQEYLMDPQPLNPDCARYLRQLASTLETDAVKAKEYYDAQLEYYDTTDKATKKYLEVLDDIMGPEDMTNS